MGLDLYLVSNTNNWNGSSEDFWQNAKELCYGRKTWDLACFFRERSECLEDDWLWRVPKSAWDEFVSIVKTDHNLDKIDELIDLAQGEDLNDDEWDELVAFVESIDDELPPTLGYDWEAAAILRWYEARDTVETAYEEDPDSVYLVMSY